MPKNKVHHPSPSSEEMREYYRAAAAGDNAPIIKFLDKYGVGDAGQATNNGQKALTEAVINGHAETVVLLLDRGVSLHADTLICAALYGHKDIVSLLLDKGVPVDGKDEKGQTALLSAVIVGYEEIARLLLDRGADIDIKYPHNVTVSMLAELFGSPEIKALVRCRAAENEAKKFQASHARAEADIKKLKGLGHGKPFIKKPHIDKLKG